jgi:hypothetical protein
LEDGLLAQQSLAFILGVTGVNTQRAFEHFAGNAKQGNLEFRRELAGEMIHNPDVPVEEDDHQSKEKRCKKQKEVHRELQTLPRNAHLMRTGQQN